MIWICIPVHNNVKFTVECINSLQEQSYRDFKIVICDDGSTDGTYDILKKNYPEVILFKGDGNLWWGGGINKCFSYVLKKGKSQDFILMLNNDLIVDQNYLKALKDHVTSNMMLGSVVVDINNPEQIVYAGELLDKLTARSVQLHRKLNRIEGKTIWDVDLLTGRGVIFPFGLLRDIGLIRADKMPQYSGDSEFSARAAKNGYELKILRNAVVYSHIKNTADGSIYKRTPFGKFLTSFFTLKSPNYYRARYYFAKTYTYKWWLPVFLILNFSRIWMGFIKRQIQRNTF